MSRLFRTSATSIILWTAILAVQAQTLLDLKSQGRNVDFSGSVSTKPFRVGTALPAVCNVGEAFFKPDAPPGSNLYACTATNTWTVQSSGGAASLPTTTNLVKGNGSGGAVAANPGADYYKPGMVISSMDLPPNVATTDAQNTYSDPGNQYFGKYDVACDATAIASDNVLVKKDSTGKCAQLTTSDTTMASGFVGVLVSGSTTANGRVRKLGVGDIKAQGTINTGDWIIVSTATAGYVAGSGSRPSLGTLIIGRANAPGGATAPVDIQIDANAAGGGGLTHHSSAINSADVSVAADNSAHTLSWDTNEEDSGGIHSTVTNPDRFTIQQTGWYSATCQVFGSNIALNGNVLELRILKNGATLVADDFFVGSATYKVFRASASMHIAATDYLTCDVRSNVSPGPVVLSHGTGLTFMQVTRLQ